MLQMIAALHPLHDGFFDNTLAVRNREKRGIKTVARDGESGIARQKILPRKGTNALKQLIKAFGRKAAQLHQDTLAAAQREIDPGAVTKSAGEEDTSILGTHILHIHAPQFI